MNRPWRTFHKLAAGALLLSLTCTGIMVWQSIVTHSGCCSSLSFNQHLRHLLTENTTASLALSLGLWALFLAIHRILGTKRNLDVMLAARVRELPANVLWLMIDLDLDGKVVVVHNPEPLAFCFGFLYPRIFLTTGLLDLLSKQELKAAFLHEEYHRRTFDPLRILAADVASATFFFLPIVREWCERYKVERELRADRFAIQQAGKHALAGAIHRLATMSSHAGMLRSSALVAGLSANPMRVAQLLGSEPQSPQISMRSLLTSSLSTYLICMLFV